MNKESKKSLDKKKNESFVEKCKKILKIVLSVYAVSFINVFIISSKKLDLEDACIEIGSLVNSTVAATLCTVNIAKDKELSKHHTSITIATVFSVSLFAISLVYDHNDYNRALYGIYFSVTFILFWYSIYLNYIANKSLEEVVEHNSKLAQRINNMEASRYKYRNVDSFNIDVKL